MEHHDLDVWPIPKDKKPQYINEPWLIDSSILDYYPTCTAEQLKAPDKEKDNIRVYIPLDINRNAWRSYRSQEAGRVWRKLSLSHAGEVWGDKGVEIEFVTKISRFVTFPKIVNMLK